MFLKNLMAKEDHTECKDLLFLNIAGFRNPFKIKRLPFMARVCKTWFDHQVLPKKRLKAKLFRGLYVRMSRMGFNPFGLLEVDCRGKKIEVPFRVRNTQYTSIYLDRFQDVCEAEVSSLISVLLPKDGVFYDVGSNFGYFTLLTATDPAFCGKAFAFEPNPESFSDLNQHVKDLGLADIVKPQCMGLFEKDDFIYVKPSGVRSGTFALGDQTEIESEGYKVKVARLDGLNLPAPAVMKIDAEGSELGVLRGAEQILKSSKPSIILENAKDFEEPFKTLEPLKFLSDHGYVIYYVGWAKKAGEMVTLHDEEDVSLQDRKALCLSRLKLEQRFLMAERLNLLAVHKDALPELAEKFSDHLI